MSPGTSSTDDLDVRLLLLQKSYRNTSQRSTNRAPLELFGWRLSTKLDLLKPHTATTIDQSLVRQKLYHDKGAKPKVVQEGEQVWIQKSGGKGYEAGVIVKQNTDH